MKKEIIYKALKSFQTVYNNKKEKYNNYFFKKFLEDNIDNEILECKDLIKDVSIDKMEDIILWF